MAETEMTTDTAAQREWAPTLHLTVSPGSSGVSLLAWNGAHRIAVYGRERAVYVHDFDHSVNGRIPVGYEVSEMRFAKQDLLVVASLTGDISLMKLKPDFRFSENTIQFQRHLRAHNAPVFALDMDPNGAHFISTGADKVVKLWSVPGQKLLGQFRKHTNAVRHLAYTKNGASFASAGDDREILEWDYRSPNPVACISNVGGGASALTYLAEGHLVVGHRDSNLRIFDARTRKPLATYRIYDSPIRSLSLHSSDHFVATSNPDDQCVSIIDLLNGAPLTTFTIKLAVKQAIFLTPAGSSANDFDTSDLLCMPGRGRKLNIFNCDLTRLVEDEGHPESLSLGSRDSPLPPTSLSVESHVQGTKTVNANFTSESEANHENAKVEKESGAAMMARRVRRMTRVRKSIKPKRISLATLESENGHLEDNKILSDQIDYGMDKLIDTHGLTEQSAFKEQTLSIITSLQSRVVKLEKMIDLMQLEHRQLAQQVATLEKLRPCVATEPEG